MYSPSAYSYGGAGTWYAPPQSGVIIEYNPTDALAFIEFSGLSAILAGGSVTSATLHLTGFGDPGNTAVVRFHCVTMEDWGAPLDWSNAYGTAYQDYKTAAYTEWDLNGLTSKDFDVTAQVNELIGMIDGDKITFIGFQPSYAGGSVGTVTATLTINTGGGGGGPSQAVLKQRLPRGLCRGLSRGTC